MSADTETLMPWRPRRSAVFLWDLHLLKNLTTCLLLTLSSETLGVRAWERTLQGSLVDPSQGDSHPPRPQVQFSGVLLFLASSSVNGRTK